MLWCQVPFKSGHPSRPKDSQPQAPALMIRTSCQVGYVFTFQYLLALATGLLEAIMRSSMSRSKLLETKQLHKAEWPSGKVLTQAFLQNWPSSNMSHAQCMGFHCIPLISRLYFITRGTAMAKCKQISFKTKPPFYGFRELPMRITMHFSWISFKFYIFTTSHKEHIANVKYLWWLLSCFWTLQRYTVLRMGNHHRSHCLLLASQRS